MVERRIELNRRYHRKKKMAKLKGKLAGQTTALVYRLKLSAGTTYVIDMVSPGSNIDPYLVLKDASGKTLDEDDDSGGGLNARITFRAEKDGIYRIQASSFRSNGNGEFTLTVRKKS